MGRAAQERENQAQRTQKEVGIPWMFTSGHSLPPRDTLEAKAGRQKREFWITESLFADNTTACWLRDEREEGREKIKEVV